MLLTVRSLYAGKHDERVWDREVNKIKQRERESEDSWDMSL